MDHKLRVLVRIDIDRAAAVLVVHGCFTDFNLPALLVLVRRAQSLTLGLAVSVDLTGAQHVDASAVEQLKQSIHADAPRSGGSLGVMVPESLPLCIAADVETFSRVLVAA